MGGWVQGSMAGGERREVKWREGETGMLAVAAWGRGGVKIVWAIKCLSSLSYNSWHS